MVAVRSRIKQAEIAAHSSGRNGGESRVFERPGAGVLQKMPIATVCTLRPLCVIGFSVPNDERARWFRHFTKT